MMRKSDDNPSNINMLPFSVLPYLVKIFIASIDSMNPKIPGIGPITPDSEHEGTLSEEGISGKRQR